MKTARMALRFAWRDLRGGLRGFGVFIACIALGVMAICGVGSVAASLADGMTSAGQAILGGDLAFSLIGRQASDTERRFLESQGTVSVVAALRAMARIPAPYPPPHAGEGKLMNPPQQVGEGKLMNPPPYLSLIHI